MAFVAEKKKEVVKEYRINKDDTGSAPVQIALLTERIRNLSEHFKKFPKDTHVARSLLMMVGNRSALLKYLAKNDPPRYQELIKKLGLRK